MRGFHQQGSGKPLDRFHHDRIGLFLLPGPGNTLIPGHQVMPPAGWLYRCFGEDAVGIADVASWKPRSCLSTRNR